MERMLKGEPHYLFRSYHLAEWFKLKAVEPRIGMPTVAQTGSKLVYTCGPSSYIFLYRFGSIVFFNVEPKDQTDFMEKLKEILGKDEIVATSDEYALEVHAGEKNVVQFERVVVDALSLDRIELIALVIAQSTTLEYFEKRVDDLLNRSREISDILQSVGRMKRRERKVNKFIGYCMSTKQDLVGSLYLLDKPDETWMDQALDNLYRDAVDMFEIKDRYKTVDYKLRTIEGNLKLIANLLANRKAAFLEWLIIILIMVEVVLFVYQLWLK